MSRVLFGKQALAELERLIDGLAQQDKKLAFSVTDVIAEAVSELEQAPLRGVPLPGGLRQLRIPHAGLTYLLLYRHLALEDRVEILLLQPMAV